MYLTSPEGAERDLLPLAVEDVELGDVLGPGRRSALGLDHDLPDLAVEVEVVDVVAAEVRLEDGEDVGDRHVEAPGLGPVEVEAELGHPGRERREDAGQLGPLAGRVQEPVGDRGQRLDPLALAVLDHELEAAGLAQAPDRRRLEDDDPAPRISAESCAWSSRARPAARSSGVSRSDQSSRARRPSPAFVWLVELITL